MLPNEVRNYLAEIGRKGGKASRRTLTAPQAIAMRRARAAKPTKPTYDLDTILLPPPPTKPAPPAKTYTPAEQAELDRNAAALAARIASYH